MDGYLSGLSKLLFGIDGESRAILGIIAKNGPITETKITRLGRRRIILSRDIIRRRLLVTDLSFGYVSIKKGRKIRNLKSKREQIVSLTFKGILASLYETPLQKNFWITNYISQIERITDKTTANVFLNFIYYSILAFMILHSDRKNILGNYDHPETYLYDNYNSIIGTFAHALGKSKIEGIPSKYVNLLIPSINQFFTSCYVIGTLLKNSLSKKIDLIKDDSENNPYDDVRMFLKRWMWTIFADVNAGPIKSLRFFGATDDNIMGNFNLDSLHMDVIRSMAADELARIKPELHISRDVFIEDEDGNVPSLIK
jgi:hypothetical protein